MFKFTKIFSLIAVLVLQVGLVSAQEMETGTGAEADTASRAVLDIITNEDGTLTTNQEGVEVELIPAGAETTPEVVSVTPAEEESMFSMRRITKWGGVASGILLVILVLMQEKGVGLSSTFGGSGGFYASKRGAEKILFYLTIIFAIAFVVLNLLAMTL